MTDYKIKISVIPNSQYTKIRSIDKYEIKIGISEPPENNKANIELIKYLSRVLKINKKDIQIISGFTSRNKILIIKDCDDYFSILEKEITS